MKKHSCLIILIITFLLGGCASSKIQNQSFSGKFQEILRDANGKDFKETTTYDHLTICKSLLKMQQYSKLDSCISSLKERLKHEPYELAMGQGYFNEAAIEVILNSLKAQEFLELGKYKKAIKFGQHAETFLGQAKYNESARWRILTTAVAPAGWLAGHTTSHKQAVYDRHFASLYGVLGVAYAIINEPSLARENLDKLMTIFNRTLHSKLSLVHSQHIANAIAYTLYSLKDYNGVYIFMTKDHRNAGETFFDGLGTLEGASLWQSHLQFGDSKSNVDFALQLQGRLMLYRSAMEIGKLNEARKGYDKLLKNDLVQQQTEIYFRVLQDRSHLALKDNDSKMAEELMVQAVDILESARAGLETESYKLGFAGGRNSSYQDLVNLLMGANRYDEAFAYAERGKARALVDMLANKKEFDGGKTLTNSEQHQLLAQLDAAEAKSNVLVSVADYSSTRSIVINKRNALMQQTPELSSLVTVSAPNVKEIQSLLPDNETLIEYYGSGDDLFAFVVTADGIRGVKLDGKGLANDVTAFRTAIIKPQANAYQQSGNKLYNRLIAPIVSGIQTKNLTIVPHGVLHYLPFSALTANHGFLIDQYNIRMLPSASVMKFLKKNNNKAGSLLAFGNPDLGDAKYDLPFAQKEAEMIVQQTAGAKLLVRSQATETAVKSYGNSFRYLHFASHGTFDAENPLQSGLLLASDEQNDGMLTVGELYDLKLNADLVTLSACETALGKVANGDDVVGFTRGFLYAGASSIVSSLWQVDDAATSDLMTSFYDNLAKEDKRSALRDAQLLTKSKYHHPYYWAAFQITGAVQ